MYNTIFSKGLETTTKQGMDKNFREAVVDNNKTIYSGHSRASTYMNRHVWHYAQTSKSPSQTKYQCGKWNWAQSSIQLAMELFPYVICWELVTSFSKSIVLHKSSMQQSHVTHPRIFGHYKLTLIGKKEHNIWWEEKGVVLEWVGPGKVIRNKIRYMKCSTKQNKQITKSPAFQALPSTNCMA